MIVYLVGVTCSGKDFFCDYAEKRSDHCKAVRVGKILRERYPPGYFNGMGAPEHTEKEALDIFNEQIEANKDKKIILVNGQPRRVSRIGETVGRFPGIVVLFYAPDEVIRERIKRRFPDDPESAALSLARVNNDKIQLYDVLSRLDVAIRFDTSKTEAKDIYEILFGG